MYAEGIAQPGGIIHTGKTLLSSNHRREDSFYCKKIFQIRRNLFTAACMPLRQVFNGHWPQFAQQVEQSFFTFRSSARSQSLQLFFHLANDLRVE